MVNGALLALALLTSGCGLLLDFDQCVTDADCPTQEGRRLACTSDRLCVEGVPAERLCTQQYPADPAPQALRLGVLLRGERERLRLDAARLAVDELNQIQGAGTPSFVIHVCDISTGAARAAYEVLARERRVAAVLGPSDAQAVVAISAGLARDQRPAVVLTSAGALAPLPGLLIRMPPPNEAITQALARLIQPQPLALIYSDDTAGNSAREALLRQLGWLPDVTLAVRGGDEASLRAAREELVRAHQQTPFSSLILLMGPDAPALLRLLSGLPSPPQILLSDDSREPGLLALAAEDGARPLLGKVVGVGAVIPRGRVNFLNFRAAFQARFRQDPLDDAGAPQTYDGIYLLAIAAAAGDPSAVGQSLHRLRALQAGAGDDPVPIAQGTYLEAVKRMTTGQALLLEGTSGTLRFNAAGDREALPLERWTVAVDKNPPYFASTPL